MPYATHLPSHVPTTYRRELSTAEVRIIRMMYFEVSDDPLDADLPMSNRLVLTASLGVILLFFAGLGSLLGAADIAATALMTSN